MQLRTIIRDRDNNALVQCVDTPNARVIGESRFVEESMKRSSEEKLLSR